jgi:nucleoside-diphosphate-sugar epimerase
MNIALVTGSAGLIGSESVAFLADKFDVSISSVPMEILNGTVAEFRTLIAITNITQLTFAK